MPLSHHLQNGDQVEIITSSKQTPKEDWLNFVVTAKAKSKIKSALKEEKRRVAEDGKEILERKLKSLKITYNTENINKLTVFFKFPSSQDLFYNVAKGEIDIKNLKEFALSEKSTDPQNGQQFSSHISGLVDKINKKDYETLLIGDDLQKIDYTLSPCCNPIPGDDVFGFITINDGIKIHRTNCPNAAKLMANYGYRIVKAKWTSQKELAFLTGLRIVGIDDVGLVNKITKVISDDFKVNIRSITISSNDGIFEGSIMIFVNDTAHLENLIKHLKQIKGITGITRFDSNN